MVLILTGFCNASFDEWNSTNKQLGLAYLTVTTIDIAQTMHWCEGTEENPIVTPNEQTIHEVNPLIAGHSYSETLVISTVGNYLLYKIVDNLKPEQRTVALIVGTVIEGYTIMKNSKDIERYGYQGVTLIGINF